MKISKLIMGVSPNRGLLKVSLWPVLHLDGLILLLLLVVSNYNVLLCNYNVIRLPLHCKCNYNVIIQVTIHLDGSTDLIIVIVDSIVCRIVVQYIIV